MSYSHTSNSAKNLLITAAASFVGMLAAMPVAFLVVSAAQPANAMQNQQNNNNQPSVASYKQYLEGYTQGYLASVKQDNSSSINVAHCDEPSEATTASSQSSPSYQPMSQAAWSQEVNNSYNTTYTSSTKTTNNVTTTINKKHVTNINSNNSINSNNTAVSQVTVKDSAGAVVASGTSAGGDANTSAQGTNVASNNTTTVEIDDSFNSDSHDKTTNVTDNSINTNIEDSFNHVDTTLNNYTVVSHKKHHHYSHV